MKMRYPSWFCAVILLVKEEFIVKNVLKKVRRAYFWKLNRNEGSDAIKNGILGIIYCFVATFILVQFTHFRVKHWIETNLLV